MYRRPWALLNAHQPLEQLNVSTLCQSDKWPGDIDETATMYESELTSILDSLILSCIVTDRLRPSYPWCDDEWREAKRLELPTVRPVSKLLVKSVQVRLLM